MNFNTYQVPSTLSNHANTNVYIPSDVSSYNFKNIDDYVASIVDYIQEYVTITDSKCLSVIYKLPYDAHGTRVIK